MRPSGSVRRDSRPLFRASAGALALCCGLCACQNEHVRTYGTVPPRPAKAPANADRLAPVNMGLNEVMTTGPGLDAQTDPPLRGVESGAVLPVDPSEDPEAWFNAVEVDMQRLLDEREQRAGAAPGNDPGEAFADAAPDATGDEAPEAAPEQREQDAKPQKRQIGAVAAELAALLREQAESGEDPMRAYTQLAALAGVEPAVLGSTGAWRSELDAALLGAEPDYALALAELAEAWLAMSSSGVDALRASEALEAARVRIAQGDTALRITDLALCLRVNGFGKYEAFNSPVFLAGRDQPIIIYTELEGFGYREAGEGDPQRRQGDRWAVEVSQELTLYHEPSGDLQAWRRGKRRLVDTSRRQRRDFYLVDQIDLPRTLTVGAYLLKVRVTDEVRGTVTERTVPISIVADPSLVGTR